MLNECEICEKEGDDGEEVKKYNYIDDVENCSLESLKAKNHLFMLMKMVV